MTDLLQYLTTLNPLWICFVVFLISYIENIFPPSPSDVVVVFGGALAGMGKASFVLALFSGVAGSTLGFATMYAIGKWFGRKIIETNSLKFIPREGIAKLESWFGKYGYWIIVGNRFLAGTRAVVSFFAGLSSLDFPKTTLLSFISSLAWYGILVYAGFSLGNHWQEIGLYLSTYSQIVTGLLIAAVVVFVVRRFRMKNRPR